MKYYDNLLLIAALMGIIANVIQIVKALWPTRLGTEEEKLQKGKRYKMKKMTTIIAIIATMASIGVISYAIGGSFKNEQLTREAWKALDAKNYEAAIKKAEECIKLFQDEALKDQKDLEAKGI